ncbi:MAG: phage major capsid protein, partial [Clostridia bacterium]|nr:phage major capsid protein [Clostridia bacterium]
RTLLKDAIEVIVNGDGADNAAQIVECENAGTLTYADLVNFWNGFDPYELNTIIAEPEVMAKMLNMEQFRDAAAGLNFHGKGDMITPLGAKLLKSPAVGQGTLIGLDKTAALEMVKAGEVMTEYDKLIDRQLERAVISCTAGFAKIFDGASKVLSV